MNRNEIRAKFFGPPRVEPFTFDGVEMQVRVPKLEDIARATSLKSERARDSFITFKALLSVEGVPIFETLEEVMGLDADKARVIDAAAAAVRGMLAPPEESKPKVEPMEVPQSAKDAADAIAKGE